MIETTKALANLMTKQSALSSDDSIVDVPIKCTPGFGCKRYFTADEEAEVETAKAKMFPMIMPTDADPISAELSSPTWAGLGTGALGALLGGGAGAGLGAATGNNVPAAALLGALLGGVGGGVYGQAKKHRKNKGIQNLMLNMPVGADRGDIELFSDPKLKQQLARDFQRRLIQKGLM